MVRGASQTPQELINGGLYSTIAVAFHPGVHRDVSYCLLAKNLGARRAKNLKQAVVARVEQGGHAAQKRAASVAQLSRRSSRRLSSRRSSCSSSDSGRDSARPLSRESEATAGLDDDR